MRSHLPEPVLMNVFTAKTNSSSVLQLHGRAQEQQMYSLVPNSWHHLTFQFSGSGQWSSPSVPLNTTLIELANRMKNGSAEEEEQPLANIWPYCRNHQNFRYGRNRFGINRKQHVIKLFVCFSFLSSFFSERRSDVVLEEKPESSLVKNVSFAGHVNKDKPLPEIQQDAPHQGQRCTYTNMHNTSSSVCCGELCKNPPLHLLN